MEKKLFALTIVSNTRESFEDDYIRINDVIQKFHKLGYETGYLGWEVQTDPKQHGCLHVHCTLSGESTPYCKKIMNDFKGVSVRVDRLRTTGDRYRWSSYVMKNKHMSLLLLKEQYETQMDSTCMFHRQNDNLISRAPTHGHDK